jgi:hypothetical protein
VLASAAASCQPGLRCHIEPRCTWFGARCQSRRERPGGLHRKINAESLVPGRTAQTRMCRDELGEEKWRTRLENSTRT